MGVTSQMDVANEALAEKLHFRIERGDDTFRVLLDRCGIRRFELCVKLIELWQRPGTPGRAKYDKLVKLMWFVIPDKVGKYRDPQAQAAVLRNRQLNEEMMAAIARDL